jgi:ATP-dependent Clp protease ATP-binding subunit ClpA
MNYNFADEVRLVLKNAREESIALQHDYVGTEHIALSLLSDMETLALLRRLEIDPAEIRRITNECVRRGKGTAHLGELPYTSRAKKVLEFAMASARELQDDTVRPRHLLIGLLLEEKGIAAEVLGQVGVTLEGVLNDPSTRRSASAPAPGEDSVSGQSVGERLKAWARAQQAPSPPRTPRPSSRQANVRELADQLEIAARAVAKAYRALEAEGPPERPSVARPVEATPEMLVGLLRPLVLAGLHLGARPEDLRAALEEAMRTAFERQ